MSARQLAERVVDLVTTQIKSNIDTVLAGIRADRNDPRISTEKPASYYISDRISMALKTPAVFVICKDIDFQKEIKGANHVNARVNLQVSVIVEDRDSEIMTRRSYRYLSAMHECLDQITMVGANNKIKIETIVDRANFSPVFTSDDERGAFRKEVVLDVTAFSYENF